MRKKTFDQGLKTEAINLMQQHQDADRLIQGSWIKKHPDKQGIFSGCFFGCMMQTKEEPLQKAIEYLHLPDWLVYLAEKIFEGLPKEDALTFPVELLKTIPISTDIESVKHKLAILRLEPLADKFKNSHPDVSSAISGVIECHKNWQDDPDWSAAGSAADSAADSAAWSAAAAAARSAAESAESAAAESAESAAAWSAAAAASAARSAAAAAAAASAARSAAAAADDAFWQTERDNLISQLKHHN